MEKAEAENIKNYSYDEQEETDGFANVDEEELQEEIAEEMNQQAYDEEDMQAEEEYSEDSEENSEE